MLPTLIIILPILGSIAYLTLGERKIMGGVQRRVGPNKVGILGLLQPLADGLKLVLKETILGSLSSKQYFIIAPLISFILSIIG
jgi:NADH:ubiquinone oxidoreductase subunit H